jgi:hypothetical protein
LDGGLNLATTDFGNGNGGFGGAGGNYFDTSLISNSTYGSLSTVSHGYVTVTLV